MGEMCENGLKTLKVKIKTASFLMDLETHIRTFSSHSCKPKDEIFASFGASYQEYGYIMETGNRKSINRFLCQYQETDWQFVRVFANLCHTVVYPNYIGSSEKLYFGRLMGTNRGSVTLTEYMIRQTKTGVICGTLRDL